jgi:serine/threonine-protein kinase
MGDAAARLAEALAGRYVLERELGRGGMATVYLAQDLRLGRRVAIKALRPELAAVVGPDRFLREIHVAATLNHPNILPLHDSGEAGDVLYYVMPFVEGESLAARLRRERPLPIDDAVGIARQVALALAAAHRQGIVHRDIKPDNILLDGERALVADFGIAHALGGTAQEKLTTTGLIVGTPTYMSPEQIGGSPQIDGRSDIYSLGCVLYEMLVGEPPYGGPSVQVILARHAAERLPSVRTVRSTVPPALELAVHRAMAKAPADRYRDATRFAAALDEALAAPGGPAAHRAWVRPARWTLSAVAGAAAVAIVAAALARRDGAAPSTAVPADVVAVLPFERAASGDSVVQRVSGEIAGLIAERLTGEGGPRAVSVGTVQEALARDHLAAGQPLSDDRARQVARDVGAGLVLTGRAAADQGRIILTAALLSASDGSVVARVEPVSVARDSLLAAADRVTADILVRASGEPLGRLPALREERIEVLRTYLAGRLAYVRGQTALAIARFSEAAAADPSFPYAPLGLSLVRGLEADDSAARAMRGRLSPADQLFLTALASVRYPDPAPEADVVRVWEDAVQHGAGYPESWFKLSEELFHRGPLIGMPRVLERATAGYRRVLELEPRFVPALGHLIDIAAGAGDTAAVRALSARYFALDSVGDLADYYRWRSAVSLGDIAQRERIRASMDRLSDATLERIVLAAQLDGTALEDAEAAVVARRSQSALGGAARLAYLHMSELALNRGRPGAAARLVAERTAASRPQTIDRLMAVVSALFSAGDTVLAASAAAEAAPTAPIGPGDIALYQNCAAGLWLAGQRQFERAARVAEQLHRGTAGRPAGSPAILCAATIEAQAAAAAGSADAGERLARLDSLARVNPATTSWILTPANLVVAQLRERQGELAEALAATRRRAYIADVGEHRILVALPAMLRAEGRLAAKTGDTAGAIGAYRHYLALLAQPEPALRLQADSVRRALDALMAGHASP